jgi:hypothetical protein
MTVRATPSESEEQPAGLAAPEHPTAGPTPSSPAPDSRRELRESRRLRRRTLWLCAAALTLCLGLTVLTVDLARSRPVPAPGTVSALPAAPTSWVTTATGGADVR